MSAGADVAQARALDRAASECGVPVQMLMALAGFQVARLAHRLLSPMDDGVVAVLGGSGNNGADAMGAARHLASWGHPVRCLILGTPDRGTVSGEQAASALASGAEVRLAEESSERWLLEGAALVIDGLLGTGIQGPARPAAALLIAALNSQPAPVLAVDVPSGMDSGSGTVAGEGVRAAHTLMLGVAKSGCLEPRARSFTGELWLADIGIPAEAYRRTGLTPPHLTGELQCLSSTSLPES